MCHSHHWASRWPGSEQITLASSSVGERVHRIVVKLVPVNSASWDIVFVPVADSNYNSRSTSSQNSHSRLHF